MNPVIPIIAADPWLKPRTAFVTMIKAEDYVTDRHFRTILKSHWAGQARGFSDQQTQQRYQDFIAGWKAAQTEKL